MRDSIDLIRIDLIRAMPKVELHVHLEGSMTPSTVGLLAERHGADIGEIWPQGLPKAFSFDGFPDFARQFFFGLRLLRNGDDLQTAVIALGADLAANGVRYAEVTTTAYTHITGGMPPDEYGAALSFGRRKVLAEHGVELAWVVDIPRDLEMPGSTLTIDYLSSRHVPDGLVAIGLGGYEVGFPPERCLTRARPRARPAFEGLSTISERTASDTVSVASKTLSWSPGYATAKRCSRSARPAICSCMSWRRWTNTRCRFFERRACAFASTPTTLECSPLT
jgi:hypothetical protein